MTPRPVSASKVFMTELVLPQHTNALGSAFGGQIMAWIDIAASIAGGRHARNPVVTASVDALTFVQPVKRGWVINLKASVNYASRTSMEIGVRVDAENPATGETFHTSSAYLTFVAVDANMKPVEVPPLLAETEAEKRRFKAAGIRRQHRLDVRKQAQADALKNS
jgi:acyl-CoA hydrolase